jgi:hypothetical protein
VGSSCQLEPVGSASAASCPVTVRPSKEEQRHCAPGEALDGDLSGPGRRLGACVCASTFKTVAVSSTQLAPLGLFGPSRSHRGARRLEWLAGWPNQDVNTPFPHTDIYGQEKFSMVQPACLLFARLCLAWPGAGHMKHAAYGRPMDDTLLAEVSCTLKRLLSDPMYHAFQCTVQPPSESHSMHVLVITATEYSVTRLH